MPAMQNLGRKKVEIASIALTLLVVAMLIMTSPAQALTLGIQNDVSSVDAGEVISFNAVVDLHAEDMLLDDVNLTVMLTNDEGQPNYTCTFDVEANKLSSCGNFEILLLERNTENRQYGYGYAVTGSGVEQYGYGYGYGYEAGVGYDEYTEDLGTGEFVYQINWTSPIVSEEIEYHMSIYAELDGEQVSSFDENEDSVTLLPQIKGYMSGGGSIRDPDLRVSHGFVLQCNGEGNLQVNWGKGEKFHLENVLTSVCSASDGEFDTLEGTGEGRYNKEEGTASWKFIDNGEGQDFTDEGHIVVWDEEGNVVLNVTGPVKGNYQAHDEVEDVCDGEDNDDDGRIDEDCTAEEFCSQIEITDEESGIACMTADWNMNENPTYNPDNWSKFVRNLPGDCWPKIEWDGDYHLSCAARPNAD